MYSEGAKRTHLYENWLRIREQAIKNAGDKPPETVLEEIPPPPPPLVDDIDIEHLSMELSATSLDAELAQEVNESGGIERVLMADPGLEVIPGPSIHSFY